MFESKKRTRRSVVLSTSTLAIAALAGCSGSGGGDGGGDGGGGDGENADGGGGDTATETSVDEGEGDANFDGWMDGVDNYDGITDETGSDEVAVAVGAEGNGGNFAFDPPAVRVTPGTEVTWRWTGQGSTHNVVSAGDGPLDSGDPVQEAGTTYSYTFEEMGVYTYVCTPHESLGMKGAVVVGGPLGDGGGDGGDGEPAAPSITVPGWTAGAGVLLAFFSPLLFAVLMKRRYAEQPPQEAFEPADGREATGPAPVEEAAEAEPAVEIGHDEYDPWGTVALVAFYFVLIALLWVFMYFVEFLGRVTVMG